MEIINNLIYVAVLIYSSIIDYNYKIIKNYIHALIIILAVFNTRSFAGLIWAFVESIVITLPFLILAVRTNKFGGGDVKFVFANGVYLGLVCNYFGILLGLIMVIGNYLFLRMRKKGDRNRQIALAPFLSAGYIIALLSKRLLAA